MSDTSSATNNIISATNRELENLRAELEHRSDASTQALDRLWKEIILSKYPDYGDWEYPGQAYRHIKAEFDDLKREIAELRESANE